MIVATLWINMNIVKMFEEWRKGKPQQQGSREVTGKVVDAPQQGIKVAPDYFERLALIESSNNPNARSKTSSAAGLYQFTEGTWNEYVKKMGVNYTLDDRFDPLKARKVVEFKTNDIVARLSEAIGREPTNTEKYMGHFMGISGARKFLNAKPTDTVDKVASPAQIRANRSIFLNKDGTPKKVYEVYQHFDEKFK
jgi:hypothetical protein